jgi:hypothetical protein
MAKAFQVLYTEHDREMVLEWIRKARLKSRVEIRGPRRTLPQNDKMWAMLTDIVKQKKTINGNVFNTDQWKSIFMQALGIEMKGDTLPTLDGRDWFTVDSFSSSKLSEEEMSNMIEYMYAWGAETNMRWSDPELPSYEEMRR